MGEHVWGSVEPRCARMATGLAGGVGGSHGEMCGALSGGVMVIGGTLGRESPDQDDGPARALAARYRERFLAELGSTQCARLREMTHSPGELGSCVPLVERAARILLELFDQVSDEDGGHW